MTQNKEAEWINPTTTPPPKTTLLRTRFIPLSWIFVVWGIHTLPMVAIIIIDWLRANNQQSSEWICGCAFTNWTIITLSCCSYYQRSTFHTWHFGEMASCRSVSPPCRPPVEAGTVSTGRYWRQGDEKWWKSDEFCVVSKASNGRKMLQIRRESLKRHCFLFVIDLGTWWSSGMAVELVWTLSNGKK